MSREQGLCRGQRAQIQIGTPNNMEAQTGS